MPSSPASHASDTLASKATKDVGMAEEEEEEEKDDRLGWTEAAEEPRAVVDEREALAWWWPLRLGRPGMAEMELFFQKEDD